MPTQLQAFFDDATSTVTYVVDDGRSCAIIDPVLDFDQKAGRTSTVSADRVVEYVTARGLRTQWLLETHAHADHLSAAPYLRGRLGGRIGIGAGIHRVQQSFAHVFGPRKDTAFDHLFAPDEAFAIGALSARALHVPGHTPADIAYFVQADDDPAGAVFVGDTLFMPDVGTARCDFPGGCAATMYRSVRRLLDLPPATRLFMCHDYPPPGRPPRWESTVAEQRAANIHLRDGIDEQAFVRMRTQRDATLSMPALILPAIQVNLNAGQLPAPEHNGVRYLKIPIDAF